MNYKATLIPLLLTGSALAATGSQTRPPLGHPILGKWTWTRSANNCTEVYEYLPNGEAPAVSGEERTDNTFTITPAPDPNGFYRMTIKTTKDYGGKDCGNSTADNTGEESVNYIFFKPDHSQYLACSEPNLDKCFGPLVRTKSEGR